MTITSSENRGWQPDWAVEPGAIVAETLRDRGMSQAELARRTGRPLKTINEIVKGKTTITADTAVQLESALGVPARFWLNLQRDYDESLARERRRRELGAHIAWPKRFPISAMAKRDLLPRTRDPITLVDALLAFFGVASPEAWRLQWDAPAVAFRRSVKFEGDVEATSAWLRWGQRLAFKAEIPPYDENKLRELIPQIRSLTRLSPIAFRRRLVALLGEVGVVVLYLPELPGTRVIGATHWVNGRPVLQLSLRHKTDDQFWFALVHELGHILQDGRGETHVDTTDDAVVSDDEKRADMFAGDVLIPRARWEAFVAARDFTAPSVRLLADELEIAAGIVVGRLQHEGRVRPGALSYLKTRIDWANP